jgi:hypothetical protein
MLQHVLPRIVEVAHAGSPPGNGPTITAGMAVVQRNKASKNELRRVPCCRCAVNATIPVGIVA